MALLLKDVFEGSSKAEMQLLIRTMLPTSATGTKTQLMDKLMAWARESTANHAIMCESMLNCRPHQFINFMINSHGGRPQKRKSDAVAEFIRLVSLSADAGADAGADDAGDAVDGGVVVALDADAPNARRKLRRKLTKLWCRLARQRLRSTRSKAIVKEIHWCLHNTDWTLQLIKQHVADKSGVSVDKGHH
jgi:hypothetical protein